MIALQERKPFAVGRTRQCYVHPDDDGLCVKVDTVGGGARSPNESERRHLTRVQTLRGGKPFEACTNFHGVETTDLGPGYVFDLIRDEPGGTISRPVAEYLELPPDRDLNERLQCALDEFQSAVMRDGVVLRDPQTYNICVQVRGDRELSFVAVDGFGHRNVLPIVDFVPFMARRATLRHLARRGLTDLAAMRLTHVRNAERWKSLRGPALA